MTRHMQLCELLEEAQLGMHAWQSPAAQRPGKRFKTKEQVRLSTASWVAWCPVPLDASHRIPVYGFLR